MNGRRWAALAVALLSLVVVGLAAQDWRAWIVDQLLPTVAYDDDERPAAPDYTRPEAWSALPERVDAADALPAGVPGVDQLAAPVDVFYLHPTTYLGAHWNGPTDDPTLNRDTDRVATGIQATAFNGCCAVYAPRYRQASTAAFLVSSDDAAAALAFAYEDVKRAFDAFLDRRGRERPFVLAGHSQGALLAERLLFEQISGTPLRDQLVLAVLPGSGLTLAALTAGAPDLPPCATPEQTGCVLAWNARGPRYTVGRFEPRVPDGAERVCTNPLSWRTDGAAVGAEHNAGAVFLETSETAPRPGFADAQCSAGTLVVRNLQPPPRDLMSRVLDAVMGPENYHPIEYQLYFMDLRNNLRARVDAFFQARSAAPAPTDPP